MTKEEARGNCQGPPARPNPRTRVQRQRQERRSPPGPRSNSDPRVADVTHRGMLNRSRFTLELRLSLPPPGPSDLFVPRGEKSFLCSPLPWCWRVLARLRRVEPTSAWPAALVSLDPSYRLLHFLPLAFSLSEESEPANIREPLVRSAVRHPELLAAPTGASRGAPVHGATSGGPHSRS